jgi:hypothetical protein
MEHVMSLVNSNVYALPFNQNQEVTAKKKGQKKKYSE